LDQRHIASSFLRKFCEAKEIAQSLFCIIFARMIKLSIFCKEIITSATQTFFFSVNATGITKIMMFCRLRLRQRIGFSSNSNASF